jgi:F420H(2)-dependent quinone reductase
MEPQSPRRSYLTPKGKTLAWITRIHRRLYTLTGGILGATLLQRAEEGDRYPLRTMQVLLLTTIGRSSGEPRTVPLPYFTYDGRTFVVASFAGGDKHPLWFLNLRARPEVTVQIGRHRDPARAVELTGAERDGIWGRLTADWPRYRLYQAGTARTIPLVELVVETSPRGR